MLCEENDRDKSKLNCTGWRGGLWNMPFKKGLDPGRKSSFLKGENNVLRNIEPGATQFFIYPLFERSVSPAGDGVGTPRECQSTIPACASGVARDGSTAWLHRRCDAPTPNCSRGLGRRRHPARNSGRPALPCWKALANGLKL